MLGQRFIFLMQLPPALYPALLALPFPAQSSGYETLCFRAAELAAFWFLAEQPSSQVASSAAQTCTKQNTTGVLQALSAATLSTKTIIAEWPVPNAPTAMF